MKRKMTLLGLIIILVLSLTGCGTESEQISDLSMLTGGKTFAVPTGTVADQFVLDKFPDAKIKYFNSALDCALAAKNNKVDAGVYDKPILENIAAKNGELSVLPEVLVEDNYGFAVQPQNTELKTVIDQVVQKRKTDGTYDDMYKRWFPKQGVPAPMPDIPLTNNKGTLRMGTAAVTEPMSFVDGSQNIVGFDIELAKYIAQEMDMQLEIVDMEFGALIPALRADKVDMIAAGLSITEERAKKVLFSESYYAGGIAAIVQSDTETEIENESNLLKTIDDIKDKQIGVLLGTVHDTYASKMFPNAKILQYKTPPDLMTAIKAGKVDGAFYNSEVMTGILRNDDELAFLDERVFSIPVGTGFKQGHDELRESFNAFLQQTKDSGIYDDMVERWITNGSTKMPVIKNSRTNGTLTVGMVSDKGLPFTVVKDNKLIGFDVELVERFAAYLGKDLKISDMDFGSLVAAVATNKVDMIASTVMITEERMKQIDFSDPYYELGACVFALKSNIAQYAGQVEPVDKAPFLQRLSYSFYSNIIKENRYLLLVDGLEITVIISLLAVLFGTLLGAVICFMRMIKNRFLNWIARTYIAILRGTPVLVLLMIIFYIVFKSVHISPVLVAVIAFGMNFAAYVSEMFRTAIESVDKGQKEAGIASGFTEVQTFLYIIMPQAIRQVLPVYKGEFISLLKMTSVVGYIAVQDLTKASDIIRSRTFDAFFPLIMVAVLYFMLSFLFSLSLDYLYGKTDPKRNRKQGVQLND